MSADHTDPQEALAAAIHNHADTLDGDRAMLLDSFAVIACWTSTDTDGGYRYSLHYDRPSVPTHHAFGLFTQALQMIAEEDEEGEL